MCSGMRNIIAQASTTWMVWNAACQGCACVRVISDSAGNAGQSNSPNTGVACPLAPAETISQNQPKWEVTTVPGRTIPARHIPAQHIPARTFGNINIPEQNIPERDIPEQVIPESKMSQKVNFYYWYYGTLCMFQMGNQYWSDWNKNIKGILVDNQRKGGPMDGTAKDVDGSWDPIGGGNIQMGGRVFSTALGTLTLEVYYRYLPIYSK